MRRFSGLVRLVRFGALAAVLAASPAMADEPLQLGAVYTGDMMATVSGGADHRLRYLDNIDLTADADLDAMIGWKGAKAHVHILSNMGARPNDGAGTLQGVDNIEVGSAAPRLFEAWIEQEFGAASIRAGLYDLNSEFYASDSAGMLLAPPFGIGSELASTGPNGPSIFPSTALAVRLGIKLPGEGSYLNLAAVNARASTLGDEDGIDFSFREGVLLIGEAGTQIAGFRLHGGGWTYSRKREDMFHTDGLGNPLMQSTWGAFAGLEAPVIARDDRKLTAFLRGGFSEGHTTPYAYGAQIGFLLEPALSGRADSAFSLGIHYARTNADFRAATLLAGDNPAPSEYALELTYADKLAPWLTVQPDFQVVANPGGIAGRSPALVAGLRFSLEWSSADD